MIRTQVQLTEEQSRKLKAIAQREGLSVAEGVRQAVDQRIAGDEDIDPWERASAMVGRFHSGPPDVAENHDKYLDEAYL